MTRSLGAAWLQGDPRAAEFLSLPPQPNDLLDPGSGRVHPAVWDSLRAHNPAHRLAPLRGPCATIVTGQQAGLFGGPLLTVAKAWTAVRWAEELTAAWGYPVVPIFWIQDEDHDVEEIAWCGGPSGSRVDLEVAAGRVSVGDLRLPADVTSSLEQLVQLLDRSFFGDEVVDVLRGAYVEGATWTDAFRATLASLFRDTPLVFFAPRRPEVAAAVAEVHARALFESRDIASVLEARADQIAARGFEVQVPIREASCSFVHWPDGNGPRWRVRWTAGDRVACPGGEASRADIERWLEREPSRFSTSALLRPIVQDRLFPTAGYVAGPGEASYWAQLEPLYARFDLRMPRVLPRARLRLLDPWARRLLERWCVNASDVESGLEGLLERMSGGAVGPDVADVSHLLEAARSRLMRELSSTTSGAEGPMGALDRKLVRAFERFTKKYAKLRRRASEERVAAAERLTRALVPRGTPRERFEGGCVAWATYGPSALFDAFSSAWAPGDVDIAEVLP